MNPVAKTCDLADVLRVHEKALRTCFQLLQGIPNLTCKPALVANLVAVLNSTERLITWTEQVPSIADRLHLANPN